MRHRGVRPPELNQHVETFGSRRNERRRMGCNPGEVKDAPSGPNTHDEAVALPHELDLVAGPDAKCVANGRRHRDLPLAGQPGSLARTPVATQAHVSDSRRRLK